jgi:hypothetical protein
VEPDEAQSEHPASDDTRLDARHVSELLDGIPGSFERTRLGLREAVGQDTISLDEL